MVKARSYVDSRLRLADDKAQKRAAKMVLSQIERDAQDDARFIKGAGIRRSGKPDEAVIEFKTIYGLVSKHKKMLKHGKKDEKESLEKELEELTRIAKRLSTAAHSARGPAVYRFGK